MLRETGTCVTANVLVENAYVSHMAGGRSLVSSQSVVSSHKATDPFSIIRTVFVATSYFYSTLVV
jgi:hypothetical protein